MTAAFSTNQTEVAMAFANWLKRRNPPESFAGDEQAEADETAALLSVLMRQAPGIDATKWVGRVTSLIAENTKYRVWPSAGEVREACERVNQRSLSVPVIGQSSAQVGDKTKLTHEQLTLLESTTLPRARHWVANVPSLAEHGRRTLAFWGEGVAP